MADALRIPLQIWDTLLAPIASGQLAQYAKSISTNMGPNGQPLPHRSVVVVLDPAAVPQILPEHFVTFGSMRCTSIRIHSGAGQSNHAMTALTHSYSNYPPAVEYYWNEIGALVGSPLAETLPQNLRPARLITLPSLSFEPAELGYVPLR